MNFHSKNSSNMIGLDNTSQSKSMSGMRADRLMKSILSTLLLFVLMGQAINSAAEEEVLAPHDSRLCSPDGIAVGGYDLVAYHTENMAVKGSAEWSVESNGLAHHFSSESNLQLFVENPEQYLPKFSGWCATALAKNKLTCPDYENFKVENGELLLFETYGFTNGRYFWERNSEKLRLAAEKNYDNYFSK